MDVVGWWLLLNIWWILALGIVLGIVFAAVISRPLAEQGLVFLLPIGTLIIFFVFAAIAGVLAAIPPARRAAKVDVLRAVTTE